ncbi:protoporphyrinogen oxidase [Veillonella agrestimuris]|uniref:protoporphyrinogen oxidase n=1 Tax=Veillonella agrestimuris TaxID=2941340 RepID=UPI00203A6B95|nr:protoporphyrinogen oxidase [Veillonella agrestimuris]
MNITIVGGGLTGLTAAYYLGHAKPDWHIQVYEQSSRLGGKIQTERVGDFVVELGPDSYLGRKTEMTDLVVDLGLGHTLVSNATGQAYVYDRGTTHPIPGGSIMGVPTEMMPFVKASLISWTGKLRAGLDFFKKPYPLDKDGDVSIGHFFKYHLGQEMMDKLIEPLLAGIYGGDIYKISLLSTFPHFIQVEQKYGNMVKGMMAAKMGHKKANVSKAAQGEAHVGDVPRAGKDTMKDKDFDEKEKSLPTQQGNPLTHKQPPAPQHNAAKGTASQSGMFRQLTGGLESVIQAIVEQMPSNVTITTHTEVSNINRQGDGYILALGADETSVYTDALIIATPPASYRQWFRHDEVFDAVRNMEQSSCAIAIMAFKKEDFDGELNGSGLLITRHTDTPLTACTILNQKWPQTTGDDTIVLRVFIGKPGNDAIERYKDEELAQLAVREIQRIMNFSAEPEWVKMNRLVRSMPQYNVGHRAAVNMVNAHVKEHYPNLYLIGTPFDGIGIPDGVKQAKELVNQLVEH